MTLVFLLMKAFQLQKVFYCPLCNSLCLFVLQCIVKLKVLIHVPCCFLLQSPLVQAIFNRNTEEVTFLLNHEEDVNSLVTLSHIPH